MRTPRRARVVFGLTAIAVGSACSLFTELDGLSGGAGSIDASPDGSAVPEPGADAQIAADVGAGDDGGPRTYCQALGGAAAFCDDFERTDPVGPWQSSDVSTGSKLTLEPSTREAGAELVARIAFTGSGVVEARLEKTFPAASRVTFAYALRIDSLPPTGAAQLMALKVDLANGSDFFTLYLHARTTGVLLAEQTFPNGTPSFFDEHPLAGPGVTPGVWHAITMVAKLDAPPRITLTVDGNVAYDAPANAFFAPGVPELSGGIHYAGAPVGPLVVHVDDVTVRTE